MLDAARRESALDLSDSSLGSQWSQGRFRRPQGVSEGLWSVSWDPKGFQGNLGDLRSVPGYLRIQGVGQGSYMGS